MTEPEALSRGDCLRLFESHGVGRVAFRTPLGPRIVPVNYAVHDGDIVFRTTAFSELGTYCVDVDVAFEVDTIDEENRTGRSAVAVGRAEVLRSDEGGDLRKARMPLPWAAGRRDRFVRLHPRDLTGRLVRP